MEFMVVGFLQFSHKLEWNTNLNHLKHKVIEQIDNQHKY